jgi:hypothetical protein
MSTFTDIQCKAKLSNLLNKAPQIYLKLNIFTNLFDLNTRFLGERSFLGFLELRRRGWASFYVDWPCSIV